MNTASYAALLFITGLTLSNVSANSDTKPTLSSNVKIVQLNGSPPSTPYQQELKIGTNTVTALKTTYRYDYYCDFVIGAKANTQYEITDQDNPKPLIMYR